MKVPASQQAGVSAEHAKVEQRHLDIARSSLYGIMGYFGISVMTDEAVASVASRIADWELATAPPEQARCSVVLTKEGDRCAAEAGHKGAHELDVVADQPQAASDGALDERIWCMECGKSVSSPVPKNTIVRAWVECPECIEKRGAVGGLAANDQKVREAAFEEAAQHKYSHGRNGAQCSCGLQFEGRADTGWPEHIRSLASPAASKPEAGKEPK